ncbi:6931_t:CDS:2 [Entrophospora sp. SA101]|nr:6931_t:CDS:2 [Entrophospora sp. SA101]
MLYNEDNRSNNENKIKWITRENFYNLKPLAEGIIHIVDWYSKYQHRKVVLKSVHDSQNAIPIILKELQAHKKFYKENNTRNHFINKCYGITKDEKKNTYMIVLKYAQWGDLHSYLLNNFNHFSWKKKLASLLNVSIG